MRWRRSLAWEVLGQTPMGRRSSPPLAGGSAVKLQFGVAAPAGRMETGGSCPMLNGIRPDSTRPRTRDNTRDTRQFVFNARYGLSGADSVEFNLVQDGWRHFGLHTKARIERALMSVQPYRRESNVCGRGRSAAEPRCAPRGAPGPRLRAAPGGLHPPPPGSLERGHRPLNGAAAGGHLSLPGGGFCSFRR